MAPAPRHLGTSAPRHLGTSRMAIRCQGVHGWVREAIGGGGRPQEDTGGHGRTLRHFDTSTPRHLDTSAPQHLTGVDGMRWEATDSHGVPREAMDGHRPPREDTSSFLHFDISTFLHFSASATRHVHGCFSSTFLASRSMIAQVSELGFPEFGDVLFVVSH